jgi:AbrB family looped-hinge helix DNA binding protein
MIIHTNHTTGGKIMNVQNGKYAWMVKIGEKGQFVIPKEARDLFDLQPGNEILVLGDENRGLAILPKEMQKEYIARIFSEIEE